MTARPRDPFDFADAEYAKGPTLRPKPAASLVLVKRDRGDIRVLMGMRAQAQAFYPGRYVFPGGRVERADYRVRAADDLKPNVLARLAKGGSEAQARALALAAIRETFEETGVLFGTRPETSMPVAAGPWQAFFARGMLPSLRPLDFIARAITPPGRPRRFDARFFMAEMDLAEAAFAQSGAGRPGADGELVNIGWLTLDEARSAKVLPITLCVLDEVEERLRGPGGTARPTPFFIPRRSKAVLKWL